VRVDFKQGEKIDAGDTYHLYICKSGSSIACYCPCKKALGSYDISSAGYVSDALVSRSSCYRMFYYSAGEDINTLNQTPFFKYDALTSSVNFAEGVFYV
jgi:hypothetical protein